MQFTITISGEGEELTPAVKALVAALAGADAEVKVEAPKTTKKRKEKENKAKAVETPTEPEEEKKEEEKKEEEKTEEAEVVEIITPETLRSKAAEVAKAGKRDEVKALLDEFGAKNVTSVAEDKRAEFMQRLEEL